MNAKKILLLALLPAAAAASPFAKSLEGEYVGRVDAKEAHFKDNPLIAAQVYREGDKYKVGIYPDLWRRAPAYAKFDADAKSRKIDFDCGGWLGFKGTITENGIVGEAAYSTKDGKNPPL